MGGGEGRRGGGVGQKDSSSSTGTRRRLHLLCLSVKQNDTCSKIHKIRHLKTINCI